MNPLEKQGFPKRQLYLEAPNRFKGKRPGSFADVYRQVTDLIRDRDGTLIALIGPRGVGKTQVAIDVAVRWLEAALGGRPEYIRARDLVLELRQAWNEAKPATVTHWRLAPLLVIDELGQIAASEWERLALEHLLDVRYGAAVNTILIANYLPEPFADLMGRSIMERLRETGGVFEMMEVVRKT